jgi:hypothetical protein
MIDDILGNVEHSKKKIYDNHGKAYSVFENVKYRIIVGETSNIVVDKLGNRVFRTVQLAHKAKLV